MKTKETKISSTVDAWEDGTLGREEEFVKVADISNDKIDEAIGLKQISIRLQQSLIDDFKFIADINGIRYQTLIRQILTRFANSEKNRIVDVATNKKIRDEQEATDA